MSGIASGIGDLVGGIAAQGAAARGYGKAGKTIGGASARLSDFLEKEYAGEAPLRTAGIEAGTTAIPGLISMATAPPELSPEFRLASREGLNQLQNNFATRGSPSSGPAAIAAGRFESGLAATEYDRMRQERLQALGMLTNAGLPYAGAGQSFYAQMYPQLRSLYEDTAGIDVASGLTKAGFYQALGSNAGALGESVVNAATGGISGYGGGGGWMGALKGATGR